MTRFKKTMVMAIVLPMVLGSASVLAYGGGGGKHNGGYHGGKGMCGNGPEGRQIFRELDLTAEQQQQMKEQRQANRQAMQDYASAHRAVMRANHLQMQELLLAKDFDEAAVRELASKMSEQQVEHRVAMLKKRHEMLNILTPEQKKQYQALQAERAEQCAARWADQQ